IVALRPSGSLSSVVMSKKLMPGFGKSGTLRIICLRSIVNMWSLSNGETLQRTARLFVDHGDALDARTGRAGADGTFDTRHRLGVPFEERLDASIEEVGDPAMDALAFGAVLGEPPKPDALDASTNHKSTGDPHLRRSLYRSHQHNGKQTPGPVEHLHGARWRAPCRR